jgi:hypothetical protein
MAASGASRATAMPAIGLAGAPVALPPKSIPKLASAEIAPAIVAEIVEIRMSRCFTCASSCAITPRSSRADSSCRMPVVAATAACSGLRPVAKALGCASSMR